MTILYILQLFYFEHVNLEMNVEHVSKRLWPHFITEENKKLSKYMSKVGHVFNIHFNVSMLKIKQVQYV